jgi:hypothetical protein
MATASCHATTQRLANHRVSNSMENLATYNNKLFFPLMMAVAGKSYGQAMELKQVLVDFEKNSKE